MYYIVFDTICKEISLFRQEKVKFYLAALEK